MTFGTTLGEHLAMAASANMFYIAIDDKDKTNMKVSEPVIQTLRYISYFLNSGLLGLDDHCTAENLRGIDANLILNTAWNIFVKKTIKLILIFLSNSFFNSFMNMNNQKRTVFYF